jgi:hypothetical protein
MATPEHDTADDHIKLTSLIAPMLLHWRTIWQGALAAGAVTMLGAGLYFWWQPSRLTATIGFAPVFGEASKGTYPNGLPFASTDVIDPAILDQVYDKGHLQDLCPREDFEAGFVVEESSPALEFLDLEYMTKLADARLTTIDRTRLQTEYQDRRLAIPIRYSLTFVRAPSCSRLSGSALAQALESILPTWAHDADVRRGVLKVRADVVRPDVFNFGTKGDQSLIMRADLVRNAFSRVLRDIADVEAIPGAALIRLDGDRPTFISVRSRLSDLQKMTLDPLIAGAGSAMGSDSARYVEIALDIAQATAKTAKDRGKVYLDALQVYSGSAVSPTSGVAAARPGTGTDVQSLTPQIDQTFINRIIEMSATNQAYRQQLTTSMITADLNAVLEGETVEHYTQLLSALRRGETVHLSQAEIAQRLDDVVDEAKALTLRFNALYDEFSRVAFRADPSLYRIERPLLITTVQPLSASGYWLIVLGMSVFAFLGLALTFVIYDKAGRVVRVARQSRD